MVSLDGTLNFNRIFKHNKVVVNISLNSVQHDRTKNVKGRPTLNKAEDETICTTCVQHNKKLLISSLNNFPDRVPVFAVYLSHIEDKIVISFLFLQELNSVFSKPIKELLSAESEVDDAALISIDSKGIDIRVRQGAQV